MLLTAANGGPNTMTADLGTAQAIDARAHGEPGKRTFQLRIIGSNSESASLWLEKQQLQALSLALTQLLSQLGGRVSATGDIASFPEGADHDFRVGRMNIGFDTSNKTVVLQIFSIAREEDDDDPDLMVRVTEGHCAALNGRLQDIIISGRPLCPLCAAPMDPEGHMCVRTNGHSEEPIPTDHLEDE